jgi:isopentenyl diphosphate isomerase/L-lactate dehydrogenase-like FMN-dependent dehydrogenase
VLDILKRELDITMALCGRRDIRTIGPEILDRAPRLADLRL